MMKLRRWLALAVCMVLAVCAVPRGAAGEAVDSVYRVDMASAGVEIDPHLYGVFLEDINYSVDGGLYAELIQNRSFEFFPMETNNNNPGSYTYSWSLRGDATMAVQTKGAMNDKNTHYVRVMAQNAGDGIVNIGYAGIALTAGEPYRVSFYTRGDYDGGFTVKLLCLSGEVGEVVLEAVPSGEWTQLTGYITAGMTVDNARLELLFNAPGEVDVDMVSLFPVHTYNNRENGLRADMVEALRALNPGFLRFPGGCIVEGEGLDNAYNWKDSVGGVEERATIFNRWRRSGTSGYYYQSYGLGFYEFFLLCEDLGCEPIPCLNSGISCYGPEYESMDELQKWIDDAIDLIEFATGDPETSEWAALRAEMGHPEPFRLTYLEIGNEQSGDERYYERFEAFERQIHALYPDIRLISSVIGLSNGAGLPTTEWLRGQGRDFVYANDEHFYMSDEWFLTNAYRYDAMERGEDAYIFAGEYACHYSGNNPLWNAVCEAAFMTGFERNADVVKLSCYAPLFSKVNYTQWQPNLIIFNNTDVWGTPSYWVDYLYGVNAGDHTLADSITPTEAAQAAPAAGKVGLASWNTRVEYDDLRVTDNATGEVLYENTFDSGDLSAWTDGQGGSWYVNDGMMRQNSLYSTDNAYHVGDTAWQDYTITVRARKLFGSEGFIIPFLVEDRLNYYHLNLGGWNNTYSAIERAVDGSKSLAGTSDFVVESNRWYDIRIEVTANTMKCYVDDEMIISSVIPQRQPVYVTSSVDAETGDVILKIVNATEAVNRVQILLENAGDAFINPTAELNVLTGTRKNITNSARNPENVAPTSSRLTGVSEDFVYEAPALSVTVLRIHTVQDSAVLAEPAAIAMSTPVGAAPELPETVEVTFADGSVGQKAVLWDHVEPTLYDWPGSYVIHGSIDGRADMVQLLLTVE
ncbi:MAG: Ig-like domain-containing protein [Clostridia bacterium]|nr:Ig-like domain-containing protein [Clostridia bacterium]